MLIFTTTNVWNPQAIYCYYQAIQNVWNHLDIWKFETCKLYILMACFFLFSWLLPSTYTKEIWNHQTIWNITTKIYKSRLPQRYTNDCYPKSIQITCPKPPKYIKNIAYNINKRLLLPAYIKLLPSRYIRQLIHLRHFNFGLPTPAR